MAAFAVSMVSGSLLLGIVAAMVVGACIAWIVAYSSIALKQNQVAVGFVLTLLCADLSSFLGNPMCASPVPACRTGRSLGWSRSRSWAPCCLTRTSWST